MKGLLLKDWYMMKKYCKAYFVIAAVFIGVSFASDNNMFFVFYPCLLCGMIPVNLLGYDERSRFTGYSGTLPYTRAQIVSAKYLIGLLSQAAVLVVTAIAQGIKMSLSGNLNLRELAWLMLIMLTTSTFTSSISLPFIFKLGAERGRSAYYVMVGFVCGASILASGLFGGRFQINIKTNVLLTALSLAGVGVYILSWYLSIAFYKKREL